MRYRRRGSLNALALGRLRIVVPFLTRLPCSVAALFLASACLASAQETELTHDALLPSSVTTANTPASPSDSSEITIEGMSSYGHWMIFASGRDCKLYDAGIEYDRHAWGRLFNARMDYVADFFPLVLLNQPAQMDIWGNPLTKSRKIVPGADISPFGFRLLWRDGRRIKPYLVANLGVIAFTQKALSSRATYENFSIRSTVGVQVRLNDRFDLRLGLFGYMHFSNAFIVPVDPGLDLMDASIGLTYHLDPKKHIAQK